MFAADIGMNNIEEINIVHEGRNYGWMKREGLFENGITRPGGELDQLFPLSGGDPQRADEGRVHLSGRDVRPHEGQAVTGGFAYRGRIPALRDKFVFGDIVRGRLFAADLAAIKKADDGIPETVAPVEEIQLYVERPERRPDVCDVPGARRGRQRHDGDARRSASQSQARRRAAADVAAGRDDPDAGARLIERLSHEGTKQDQIFFVFSCFRGVRS